MRRGILAGVIAVMAALGSGAIVAAVYHPPIATSSTGRHLIEGRGAIFDTVRSEERDQARMSNDAPAEPIPGPRFLPHSRTDTGG